MIKNLWKITDFYCSYRHIKPVKLNYLDGPSSLFYACPKYYPENRDENERACPMRMNMIDAENLLDKFSKIIEDDEDAGIFKDYTNFEFDYKTIHAKVLYYSQEHIEIDIFNKKSLK